MTNQIDLKGDAEAARRMGGNLPPKFTYVITIRVLGSVDGAINAASEYRDFVRDVLNDCDADPMTVEMRIEGDHTDDTARAETIVTAKTRWQAELLALVESFTNGIRCEIDVCDEDHKLIKQFTSMDNAKWRT